MKIGDHDMLEIARLCGVIDGRASEVYDCLARGCGADELQDFWSSMARKRRDEAQTSPREF